MLTYLFYNILYKSRLCNHTFEKHLVKHIQKTCLYIWFYEQPVYLYTYLQKACFKGI